MTPERRKRKTQRRIAHEKSLIERGIIQPVNSYMNNLDDEARRRAKERRKQELQKSVESFKKVFDDM